MLTISGGLLLTGCGRDDSSSDTEAATFSLNVSDAPVDEANKVVLTFNNVVLVPLDPETGEHQSIARRRRQYIYNYECGYIGLGTYSIGDTCTA
ncbi:DUF4382 domain-containing protein [Vibrio sp. ES.051]|uniref:DUF4382 domain-containing protein n=1 Tax=Vibrio sp. ES.051 TaxID=1761909 RepID=UPI00211D951B|nr:DUF4382 domain-containing protein [Vibrio sp. ES.051]